MHIINDIGGVSVCVPFTVNNPLSGLKLTTGEHRINGITALAFWRTREDIGTGSDLQRIQRDQFLMAQLFQGVLHSSLLSSPSKLLSVISDAARAMTTDTGLTQNGMLQLAGSLRGLSGKDMQFVTAPNIPYPGDPAAEVQFSQPQAHQLFTAIAHDKTPPTATSTKAGQHPAAHATASPSTVHVQVLNGSGIAGVAGQAAASLAGRGFHVTGTGDAPAFTYQATVIEYRSASQLPQVNTLTQQIAAAQVRRVAGLPQGTLDLIIGSGFTGLRPQHPSPSHSASAPVASLGKSYGGITGNASCSSDTSAFTGPLSP